MKKVIHATVLSAFLLASTHSMAVNQQAEAQPEAVEIVSQQNQQRTIQQPQAQYEQLRADAVNMTPEQAAEVEAGVNWRVKVLQETGKALVKAGKEVWKKTKKAGKWLGAELGGAFDIPTAHAPGPEDNR